MDELSQAAELIGAVNTVVNRDGYLFGENTDGKGFLKALTDNHVPVLGKHIVLLGAGGAARSIAVECALAGADTITIINRNSERGQALAALLNEKTGAKGVYLPWTGSVSIPACDILINGTCVGLYPDPNRPDIQYDTITSNMVVCDVIFNPPETPFLLAAAAQGARTIDGLGMLVNQGAVNFELWTGVPAPWDVMYEALKGEFM